VVLVEHSRNGNTIVLRGSLDVRCTALLRTLVYAALDEGSAADGSTVVVDLTGVDSVDMTTLKLLAVASRSAQRHGRRLLLRGASSGVRRLLHLSHLRGLLAVEPTHPTDAPV
jgi:anti-anti-sigma factor